MLGIENQIDEHLLQLAHMAVDLRELLLQVLIDLNRMRIQLMFYQGAGLLQSLGYIEVHPVAILGVVASKI